MVARFSCFVQAYSHQKSGESRHRTKLNSNHGPLLARTIWLKRCVQNILRKRNKRVCTDTTEAVENETSELRSLIAPTAAAAVSRDAPPPLPCESLGCALRTMHPCIHISLHPYVSVPPCHLAICANVLSCAHRRRSLMTHRRRCRAGVKAYTSQFHDLLQNACCELSILILHIKLPTLSHRIAAHPS